MPYAAAQLPGIARAAAPSAMPRHARALRRMPTGMPARTQAGMPWCRPAPARCCRAARRADPAQIPQAHA